MAKNMFRFIPGKIILRSLKVMTLFAGVLFALSCAVPQGMGTGAGRLTIALPGGSANGGMARSVLSNDAIAALQYRITLTGPGGTLDRTAAGGNITVSLQSGEWIVAVKAYNSSDTLVGSGSETATVVPGKPASVIVKMYVDPGYKAGLTDIYIHTEAELRKIGTDFAIDGSKNFHLENNITLTEPWTPIGDDGDRFKAVFDGAGHTVTVAAFSADALAAEYMGFFGYTEGGEIKNLHIKYELGGTAHNTNTNYYIYAGGITGRAQGTTISNARVSGSFRVSSLADSAFHIGGIAGAYYNGIIENCHVTGAELGGGAAAADISAGGIAGELASTGSTPAIKSSSFTGTVVIQSDTGSAYGGGIVGRSYGGTITACYAAGTIDVSSSSAEAYAGGIAGSFGYFPITGCYAYAGVRSSGFAKSYAGGIAGYASEITRCYAAGAVKAEGSGAVVYAGGIAGQVTNTGGLTNCVVMLNALDGGSSADVHTLFGGYAIWFALNSDNSVWDAIALTRGGTTYANADSFAGLILDSDKDIAAFSPAGDYTDSDLVSDTYPGWNFADGGDWKFISGCDFPVLSWQTLPPDLSHVPDSVSVTWP
jgi:hypothetical protein